MVINQRIIYVQNKFTLKWPHGVDSSPAYSMVCDRLIIIIITSFDKSAGQPSTVAR